MESDTVSASGTRVAGWLFLWAPPTFHRVWAELDVGYGCLNLYTPPDDLDLPMEYSAGPWSKPPPGEPAISISFPGQQSFVKVLYQATPVPPFVFYVACSQIDRPGLASLPTISPHPGSVEAAVCYSHPLDVAELHKVDEGVTEGFDAVCLLAGSAKGLVGWVSALGRVAVAMERVGRRGLFRRAKYSKAKQSECALLEPLNASVSTALRPRLTHSQDLSVLGVSIVPPCDLVIARHLLQMEQSRENDIEAECEGGEGTEALLGETLLTAFSTAMTDYSDTNGRVSMEDEELGGEGDIMGENGIELMSGLVVTHRTMVVTPGGHRHDYQVEDASTLPCSMLLVESEAGESSREESEADDFNL
ncbi:hypothetical protein KIPB_006532 [Kipferlia bialata]|uniref:Uncharacterized protein n=1 Tax=Kipferlia bialata TaxID=797122 RepID=A0A9K3GJU1_9EUKA|nr:hypothetical protein KIPB_006532 [Kipferlia bialata]|eukprot:g6532.t1